MMGKVQPLLSRSSIVFPDTYGLFCSFLDQVGRLGSLTESILEFGCGSTVKLLSLLGNP